MFDRALKLTLILQLLPTVLAATGIPIISRVLEPGGEPLAGVEVGLEPIPSAYERSRLRLAGQLAPESVARSRTGVDGTFELIAPEAGMWKVVVSSSDFLSMEYRLIGLVEPATLPTLELAPAANLEVRLVDTTGAPLAGVVGATTVGLRDPGWKPRPRLTRAGTDGIARLPLGGEERIRLEVLADGYPLVLDEVFGESSVEIQVPAGVARTARITRQNRPVPQAVAFQENALLPLGSSDEEGLIPLVLPRGDTSLIRVSTAERWHGSFDLDLAQGQITDVPLDPPTILRGHVFDLLQRDPVAGALVWMTPGEFAVTDDRGRYALETSASDSREPRATAAWYREGFGEIGDGGEAPVIALMPAAALSGRVIDREGDPIVGAMIEFQPLPPSERFPSAVLPTDEPFGHIRTSQEGEFQVTGLAAGLGYRLNLQAEGFSPRLFEVEALEPFELRAGLVLVLDWGRLAFGRIVDEDDRPVVGAEIGLQKSEGAPDEQSYFTDATGRFEIQDLAAGRYDLEVRGSGFAPARVPGLRVPENSDRFDFGTLVLIPGATIEGRVSDASGQAIAGAGVMVETGNASFPVGGAGPTTTDSQGRFVVADLLPGQPVALAVSREGYSSVSVESVRPPTDQPLQVVLSAAGHLLGKVVDHRGQPISGATVEARPDLRQLATEPRRSPAPARSEADGTYLITDVEPGMFQVTVSAEGYQQQARAGIEIESGEELELDFELEAGAIVEGTVTTADGAPVVQASIQIAARREGFFGQGMAAAGQTDSEGHYRVTGAATGSATIAVYHGNGRQLTRAVEIQLGRNVVDLELERGFEVSGQVVFSDGTAVGGADVSIEQVVQPGMAPYSFGSARGRSTGDGGFLLTDVKAGKYALVASLEGYATARSETFEVAGDVSGALLELDRGATLEGRVLGLDFDELGALALVAQSERGDLRRGRVDFDGEYAFDGLAPGAWHVQAQVGGSGRSTQLRLEISEGVSHVHEDIEFGGFTLTGVVLEGGQPLANARIGVNGSTGSSGHGLTGVDGRFRVSGLRAGDYQLMVLADAGVQHTEALDLVGDHDVSIEISTGSLRGRVFDATSGEPLGGVAITLERLDGHNGGQAQSNSRGEFRMGRLRQGRWRVLATKSGYGSGEATATVADGVANVEIQMTPTEGVTFEVVLESGLTVPAVQVAILDASGRRIHSGHYSVISGKVRISTLSPGRWDLVVQGGDSAATHFAVNAPGDQGRLVLPMGGNLRVRSSELEGVPMASITLTGPGGRPFVATAGAAFGPGEWMMNHGESLVPGLTPGVWSFTVRHGGQSWSGSAPVAPGQTTEVSLQ